MKETGCLGFLRIIEFKFLVSSPGILLIGRNQPIDSSSIFNLFGNMDLKKDEFTFLPISFIISKTRFFVIFRSVNTRSDKYYCEIAKGGLF